MVWSVLSNGKAIEAPTPTRDQIAAAEAALTGAHPRPAPRHMPPAVAAKFVLMRLGADGRAAVRAEAVRQYAAGSADLWNWFAAIEAGKPVLTQSPTTIGARAVLIANGVLTSAQLRNAFGS